ncbi:MULTISPECIES: hypothetical protein [Burkholderia]|uniref:Uncharacterized protein n=1 Tax=Burkholderia savannae TaxID=1637837 RepID=A0ABR5TDX5_9BURK|nr:MULTISPECIES: hypothetical protein [Burkholderia]AOJ68964.1 hypothetical protein WS78_09485 [Burkholderia savannae]AOJ80958.1 hypothetical protein WS86_10255 [Burkholderia savannae]AOK47179.1 hypothetical protein WT60_10225 [Burkholderia sp. MSMB617WGS]KGS08797.1 hypothetical protein X946_222 [Burkholderia sp. ABCPW 111]KVG37901.1 hypothetical protein WS77_22185 [Burkholderia sp. MSMB0265]
MEPKGNDIGDFGESYKGYEIEVKTEQVWAGEKAHYRVLQGGTVMIDWRLVHIDGLLLSERRVIEQTLAVARSAVDRELLGAGVV